MTAETRLLDYSVARPSPAAIKKAGAVGVMRYLSFTGAKNLTDAERDRLHRNGLVIGLVWETTANRAAQGTSAGHTDRAEAEKQARKLGYPAACPIFYAVDFDATPAQVAPYFAALRKTAGSHPVGIYGGAHVMALPADAYWQTAAWSAGVLSGRAHLYQRAQRVGPNVAGTDENVVCRRITLWGAAGPVVVAPPQAPKPVKAKGFALVMRVALHTVISRAERRRSALTPQADILAARGIKALQRMRAIKESQ